MGASIIAAVMLMTASSGGVGAPRPPVPGSLETYKDWTIGCDNRNRCEAIALLPENGDWPDNPMMIGVVRDAGPDAATEVWFERDGKGQAEVSFIIDGRRIASATARGGTATVRGPQASALAIGMARGTAMEVRLGGKPVGRPSLSGSAAALRYMDARQGRAGTTTALIASGPLGVLAVKAAPAAPRIQRAPVPAGPEPAALWRDERTRIGSMTGCTEEMNSGPPMEQHRLSKTETLILVPCGAGAYNFSSVPVIASGVPGRRVFRLASFDYKPGWTENPAQPMLVNAGWDAGKSRLDSFAKGRGLGDCGGSESYVWDGSLFRLVEATAMGECRGAWHWITTWSASVDN
ncbi:hypothetical protein J3E64_000546 [Sphingobium sp. OAS761]|uniref:DUF1176 domain-containing protein n=1 Tax=Sphingobium sp. OAS761 TaxID=2817901 RepID=UPI0020A18CD0|nr:DUF1176 domain-containing protein [Sphingobium sp. OAS761]MCP1468875.1 hypothetical protein [Sphingobium sp. OAS761]